jgi:hypothetical protein
MLFGLLLRRAELFRDRRGAIRGLVEAALDVAQQRIVVRR